jgi:hypothetical protein
MSVSERPAAKAAIYRLGPRTFVPLTRGAISNFTDPMTNAMSLSRIDVRAMLKSVECGKLPLSTQGLRFFLHELTHHATFANSVGGARAALSVSVCARASIGPQPGSRAGLWLAQRDDIVLRCFEIVMEPLIEGLALFAEHDVRWSTSPYASHPLLHLLSMFLAVDAGKATLDAINDDKTQRGGQFSLERGEQAYRDWIDNYLMTARTGSSWVGEKRLLLRQPLLGGAGPPYLLGYLAVKRVYLTLRRVNRGFWDTDLFLMLLLKYWFSNDSTAELLLALDDAHLLKVQETIAQFSECFQDMWEELYKAPSKIVPELLAALDAGLSKVNPTSVLGLSAGVRTAADNLNVFVPRFQKHRLLLRLGMVRVNVATDQDKGIARVREADTVEETELFRCPYLAIGDQGEFPGSVEIVRTYDGKITAIVVLGPTGLVAVRDLCGGEWNDPPLAELFDDLPSLEHVEASAAAYGKSGFARMWEHEDFRETNEHQVKQADELRTSAYLQLAFRMGDQALRAQALELLGTSGFEGLFPDREELKELALFSLHFGGPGSPLGVVEQRLQRPADGLLAQLHLFNGRSREKLGIDLFEIDGDYVTAAV